MPKIAEGSANKVWVVPSEITKALEGLGSAVHEVAGIPQVSGGPRVRVDTDPDVGQERRGRRAAVQRPTKRCRRRSPRPRAPLARRARLPERHRRRPPPPAADPGDSGDSPERRRRRSELLGDRRHPARRHGGRDHQHRGGVGNADHVPDPPRVRHPSGDRQRVEHDRAGARVAVRGDRLPRASSRASARRLLRLGSASLHRRHRRGAAPAVAAVVGVRRDRAGADRARLRARRRRSADPAPGGRPRRGARRRGRARRVVGVAGRARRPACTAATSAPPRACC